VQLDVHAILSIGDAFGLWTGRFGGRRQRVRGVVQAWCEEWNRGIRKERPVEKVGCVKEDSLEAFVRRSTSELVFSMTTSFPPPNRLFP
jgi:hypothetical protein